MAERALPGLGLIGFWDLGADGWKDQNDQNLLNLSALTNLKVLNSVTTEPGSPVNGDIYLLTSGANANKIAVRDNGAWVYLTPRTGWRLYDATALKFKYFNGSAWVDEIPTTTGGMNLLAAVTDVASVATIDFTSYIDTTYDVYKFLLRNIAPSTFNMNLIMRMRIDGTWIASGSTAYYYHYHELAGTTENTSQNTGGSVAFISSAPATSAANSGVCGEVTVFRKPSRHQRYQAETSFGYNSGAGLLSMRASGGLNNTGNLDGVRFMFNSGNISEGSIFMYGLRKSA